MHMQGGFRMSKKIYVYLCIFTAVMSILTGCHKSTSEMQTQEITTAEVVYGADGHSFYSYTDSGFFKLSGNVMAYYDMETKQSYVLCANPGCSHATERCSAYYTRMDGIRGLAGYRGGVYAFIFNESTNSYEFTKMNMQGENREVLAALEIGNYNPGEWVIESISECVYVGDRVWACLYKTLIPEKEQAEISIAQLVGIHLETGEITVIGKEEELANGIRYNCEYITDEYVILTKRIPKEERLSEEEFYEAYDNGRIEENKYCYSGWEYEQLYAAYCASYYPFYTEPRIEYVTYHIETKEMNVLETEENPYVSYDEAGLINGCNQSYIMVGLYDKKIVCQKENWNTGSADYFLWDIKNNMKETFLEESFIETMALSRNSLVSSYVLGENELLMCEELEQKGEERWYSIYSYHFDTKELEKLYEIGVSQYFKPQGVCGEYLVGWIDYGNTWAYISIDDFKKGNIEKAVKLWDWGM